MLDFYKIVKENLTFNRFEFNNSVCLEYTCPIDASEVGIFSQNDYVVHVLSGKKTYKTIDGTWTLEPGQTLYLKKGAEVIHQYFDDEYCMLGFFVTDNIIRETYNEIKGQVLPGGISDKPFTGREVTTTPFLEGYFHSMLNYFRGIDRPPDPIMALKLKELLVTLTNDDPVLAAYFYELSESSGKPSIAGIMEQNFCFNLKLEDYAELCHRSLSSFKRDFQEVYQESPGKWIVRKRVEFAANLMLNTQSTVTEIAFASGFEDLSHFSRVFKNQLGYTPSEYRNREHTS